MNRRGIVWFGVAGLLAIARWVLDFADIQYYDPGSLLDYSGVFLQTAAGLTTGIALLVMWRNPPVAGIVTLTVGDPSRWAGVFFILGATGGMLGLGLLIMGLTRIALSLWMPRNTALRQPVLST